MNSSTPFILSAPPVQTPRALIPATRPAEGKHSELAASTSHRWMRCPGSITACRGIPSVASPYADKGTAVHRLIEHALREGRNSGYYIGRTFGDHKITPSDAKGAQIHLDTVRRLADGNDLYIEQVISLAELNPPVPMFGTADSIVHNKRRHEVHVVDYKNGWNQVSAQANSQLLYYGLGAVLLIDAPISSITLTIVQPNSKGDAVRTASVDAVTLTEWSLELIDCAHATQQPDAPTVAGSWCLFCPAKNTCLTHQNAQADAAYQQFSPVVPTPSPKLAR
jgi:hypothetical protein